MTMPPLEEASYRDRVLMAEIGKLNEQLGHYILRYLAADALQADPISVTEEHTLAETMVALAGKVQARSHRRDTFVTPPVVEGEATVRGLTDGRPSER